MSPTLKPSEIHEPVVRVKVPGGPAAAAMAPGVTADTPAVKVPPMIWFMIFE